MLVIAAIARCRDTMMTLSHTTHAAKKAMQDLHRERVCLNTARTAAARYVYSDAAATDAIKYAFADAALRAAAVGASARLRGAAPRRYAAPSRATLFAAIRDVYASFLRSVALI